MSEVPLLILITPPPNSSLHEERLDPVDAMLGPSYGRSSVDGDDAHVPWRAKVSTVYVCMYIYIYITCICIYIYIYIYIYMCVCVCVCVCVIDR